MPRHIRDLRCMCVGYIQKYALSLFSHVRGKCMQTFVHFFTRACFNGKVTVCSRHNNNQHIYHVGYQNMGDSFLCRKADLMHFALMEIRTVGVSWRQIKAADRSNPEPSPLAVPPTIHSPFLSMCGKGWLRPSSDSYAHTSNHCHQCKRERWKAF